MLLFLKEHSLFLKIMNDQTIMNNQTIKIINAQNSVKRSVTNIVLNDSRNWFIFKFNQM